MWRFLSILQDEPTLAKAGFIVDFVGNNTGVLLIDNRLQ